MPKPTKIPIWANTPSAVKIDEPNTQQQDIGYTDDDYPTYPEFNYLFNVYYQWIVYIDNELSTSEQENSDEIASISKTFVYLDDSTYNNITDPTINDKINKKVSEAKDIIDSETDAKIANLQTTTVGNISGLSVTFTNNGANVSRGVCDMHLQPATAWDYDNVFRGAFSNSLAYSIINNAFGDWAYLGVDGIMAENTLAFGPGVPVYLFVVNNDETDQPLVVADTSINGNNAVNTYEDQFTFTGTPNIYIRRIAASITITDISNSNNTIILPAISKGDRFFTVVTDGAGTFPTVTQYSRKVYYDNSGEFIPATAVMGNGVNQQINLQIDQVAPLINNSIYHVSLGAGGAANTQQSLTVAAGPSVAGVIPTTLSTMLYTKDLYDDLRYVPRKTFDISQNTMSVTNFGSDILYLDIEVYGWTDYRERYEIG